MSTTSTLNPHSLANVIPADYAWVGVFYHGTSDNDRLAYTQDNLRHVDFVRTAADRNQQLHQGRWTERGTCDFCGAWFAHGAYFLHVASGDIIHCGHDCADKLDLAAGSDRAEVRGAIARAATAEASRIKNLTYRATLLLCAPGLAEAFEIASPDNEFVSSVRARFHGSHPELTERQVLGVIASAAKDVEFAARRAAEAAVLTPVITGKGVVITGTVVSTKWKDGYNAPVLKMLVLDDRNFKVWGTVPAALEPRSDWVDGEDVQIPGAEKGARVSFTANVEASDDDPTFGFYSRPRKAALLTAEPAS